MKHIGINVFALACVVGLSVPCVAQDNPWNGSWKLDKSTVKFDGPIISVATKENSFIVSRYGRLAPNHICDGQPRKQDDGRGTTCITTSTGYVIITAATEDGKQPELKETVSFSKDGNSMTIVNDTTQQGRPIKTQYISKRISGGPGFGGEWKQVTPTESPSDPGILGIDVQGDSVVFTHSDSMKPMTYKLDGTPTTIGGQRTVEAKLDGSHTLTVTNRNNGNVAQEITFVLSADGHTIQEKEVTPEPAPGKTLVSYMTYHKN
jgi:hypothetical protein